MSLTAAALFALGLAMLLAGAEVLVRGASRLAAALGISPLVIGLTVVAFGTSSAELAVSVGAALSGNVEIALGNVVGSNIFNVLVVLGVSALVTPLVVAQQLVRLDVPLMVGAAVVMVLMGLDGAIGRIDGVLLVAGVIAYTAFAIRQSRREQAAVAAEYEAAFALPPNGPWVLARSALLVLVGLGLLVAGADRLVDGAVAIAEALGLSQLVIGLTIIAVGTSLPEVATSVVASVRGERDIAVGNVVGSNLFNILAVLGATAAVAPAGVPVPRDALLFDLPVMLAVCVACLPVFYSGMAIDRWEGGVFVLYYVGYTTYVVLKATNNAARDEFGLAMLGFVVPLTVLTLLVIFLRGRRAGRTAPGG